jgi:hypothetical protein
MQYSGNPLLRIRVGAYPIITLTTPRIELVLLRQHQPLPFWGRYRIAKFFGRINP